MPVEAELGRLAGEEDGLSVAEKEAKMTDPAQVCGCLFCGGVRCVNVCVCVYVHRLSHRAMCIHTHTLSHTQPHHQPSPRSHIKQVPDFVARTNVDLVAVTIGNVHGRYAVQPPQLDMPRLEAIRKATDRYAVRCWLCVCVFWGGGAEGKREMVVGFVWVTGSHEERQCGIPS